ncbi:hypothetical protein GCM10008967_30560 [Bacillus carboniphilus]|uniref:Uncharacterized protein n=1 Tax=Bacillus carboniphilus TaxID=86663 RepID=A0ABP3G9Q1_9BACI
MESHITNEVLENVFFIDGSLRDIYVLDADKDDWQKFYDWVLANPWEILFYKDGQIAEYKEKVVTNIFKDKENGTIHLMSIKLNSVLINCHFFSEEELELDIDPKDVKDIRAASTVFDFMRELSINLDKESILTGENCPENPLVSVRSDGKGFIRYSA